MTIRPNDTQNIMAAGALISCAKDRHLNQFTNIPRSKFQRVKGGSRNRVGAKLKNDNSENVAHLVHHEEKEPCPLLHAIFTYSGYIVLVLLGYINDLVRPRTSKEKHREGYTPLYSSFEGFYTRHIYRRVRDAFGIPICSVPGEYCTIKERRTTDNGWTFKFTGETVDCINTGSYNYLGFAESVGPCAEVAIKAMKHFGVNPCSSKAEMGSTRYLIELEKLVARFLGVDDCITCAMGFATNFLNLPCILDENCLAISDEKNHASIILGLRTSGATVALFRHNNMSSLERRLRQAVLAGRPKTRLPWSKILIVVEGIYSMEGTIAKLPEIVALKKKYKAYLYLDEAHSIGALGPRGRGVCDYWGINPREVDILMGTFTKSFGSAGGYIAGSRDLITMLRRQSHSQKYGGSMSAPVAAQIISSMKIIMGEDGTNEGIRRIRQLARNATYFRQKLRELGFIVYGSKNSPVVPVGVFVLAKLAYCVREMRKSGVAIVAVGFPATPLVEGRIRFCLSSAHTKEMLDQVLKAFGKIGEDLDLRVSRIPRFRGEIRYHEDDPGVELGGGDNALSTAGKTHQSFKRPH